MSNVKGAQSAKWGSYEQAYSSFTDDLRAGCVIKDMTRIQRTRIT